VKPVRLAQAAESVPACAAASWGIAVVVGVVSSPPPQAASPAAAATTVKALIGRETKNPRMVVS